MRQQHRFAIVALLVWGTLDGAGILKPALVHADTVIIPSAAMSERYDSNIFRTPRSRQRAGTTAEDFISTVGGGVQVLHKSREVDARITAGADANVFVNNPGLNFFTTRLEGTANLDGWVSQFVREAKLRVSENFQYTPETPGFVTGVGGEVQDPFLRGIQGFRANTFSNTTSVEGSYRLDKTLSLEGRYFFATRRVGRVRAGGAVFFDTDVHAWRAGPRWEITPIDHIRLLSEQTLMSQSRSSSPTRGTFETLTQTLSVNYNREMPDWTFGINGGVTLIEPADRAHATGGITFSTHPERATTIMLDLSRRVAPSFFLQGGVIISNVGRVQLTQRLSERLYLSGSASYAYNETVPIRSVITNNITLSTSLNYNLTRNMILGLFYNHTDFKVNTSTNDFTVPRDEVNITLTTHWE